MLLKVIRFISTRPVSILLIIGLTLIIGVLSLINIPVEIRPEQEAQGIQIRAQWGQYPPEIVQRQITRPIEDTIIQLKDVSDVESTSGIGLAYIKLTYPKQIDLKYAYVELRERISQLREQLPEDATISVEPRFGSESEENNYSQAFFEMEIVGPLSLNELRRIAKETIQPQLVNLDGIANIDIIGGADAFLQIKVDPNRMKQFGLSMFDISNRIRSNRVYEGLGEIRQNGESFNAFVHVEPQTIVDWENISIHQNIRLKNIAEVRLAYKKTTSISRHNFDPLVLIQIYKSPGINALRFSASLRKKIETIALILPPVVQIRIADDSAELLANELNSLWFRALCIFTIVFGILFMIFRRWMVSTAIILVIFISIITSATLLYWAGYTINVVTLAGMALVFGILVDNSIVVLENIQRYRMMGRSALGSSLRGTLEVFQPLLASTATTVLVFFALLLLKDRLGTQYKPMAFVLGFSLVTSLIIAITFIPALMINWPRIFKPTKPVIPLHNFQEKFAGFLKYIISKPKRVLSIAFLLLSISSLVFWKNVDKGGYFWWGGKEKINVYVNAPRGVRYQELNEITQSFETIIRNHKHYKDVRTTIDENNQYSTIVVSFSDSIRNGINPLLLKENLITQAVSYAGVGISISGFGMPYWNGGYKVSTYYNTRLKITGPDYYRLMEIGESILDLAKMDRRVTEGIVSPSQRGLWESESKKIQMTADIHSMWNHGISIADTRRGMRQHLATGLILRDSFHQDQRYAVKLVSREDYPALETLQKETFKGAGDVWFPVRDMFRTDKVNVRPWIDKKNQQYRFTIAWQYRGPEKMRSRHEKGIIDALELPPGYHLEKQDWGFLTEKEESALLQILLYVTIGAFMILAALYESLWQPFVIFFTIPFALIGVFGSYAIFDREFNVNGYIGLILLMGIVVNNGIVLVERINQLKDEKPEANVSDVLIRATIERIRPIIITTLTTIGGLIPLLFLPAGDTTMAKILEELSFITVGGLVSSTLFTVTLIPVVYKFLSGFRNKSKAQPISI